MLLILQVHCFHAGRWKNRCVTLRRLVPALRVFAAIECFLRFEQRVFEKEDYNKRNDQ